MFREWIITSYYSEIYSIYGSQVSGVFGNGRPPMVQEGNWNDIMRKNFHEVKEALGMCKMGVSWKCSLEVILWWPSLSMVFPRVNKASEKMMMIITMNYVRFYLCDSEPVRPIVVFPTPIKNHISSLQISPWYLRTYSWQDKNTYYCIVFFISVCIRPLHKNWSFLLQPYFNFWV